MAPQKQAKLAAACSMAALVGCLICAAMDSTFPLALGRHDAALVQPLALLFQQSASVTTRIPPVQVLVCVESLCIDSQRFFRDQLMVALNALGHNVMNLTVVSFGNAKLPSDSSRTVTCQHGFGECDTNVYQQCAAHLYPDPAQHLPYLACLFATLPMGHRDAPFPPGMGLEPCARDHGLDFESIRRCHDDPDLAWTLQQQAAAATPARHDHVPWIEINGQHMDEASENLLQQVCKAYRQAGGHTAGCSAISMPQ